MRPLLLPAPREHSCLYCGITSHFRRMDEEGMPMAPVFFVERVMGKIDPVPYELCDLCDIDFRAKHYRREPKIWLFWGVPIWESEPGFFGFEEMAMLCVTDASNDDWEHGRRDEHETWLYFRDRVEWTLAYRLARLIKRHGFEAIRFACQGYTGLDRLPAHKPPGISSRLSISVEILAQQGSTQGGPLWGLCDGCGAECIVRVKPGTQWASCGNCWEAGL